MADPGVQALAMLRGRPARGPQRCAYHQRHFELATRHIMHFRSLIDDLIHDERHKIAKHDVDDWPHAGHRSPYAQTGNARLRNGGVDDACCAELFDQSRQDLEGCSRFCYVFTHDEDPWIAPHLFGQRLAYRLAKGYFAHASPGML